MQNDNGKKKIKKPSGMRTNFAFQAAVLAGAGRRYLRLSEMRETDIMVQRMQSIP
mgnify:CR=1 FL=1